MNFWTFLDRNIALILFTGLLVLLIAGIVYDQVDKRNHPAPACTETSK
jgi:hypothetical protein